MLGVEFDCLQQLEPVFEKYRAATGVRLSEYDDVRLGPPHVALLHRLLDEARGASGSPGVAWERFAAAVADAARSASDLLLVGD